MFYIYAHTRLDTGKIFYIGVFKTQKEAAKANFMSQSHMNKLIRDESNEKYRYLDSREMI